MKKVEMNKDIRKYKEKMFFMFSKRETLCLFSGCLFFLLVKSFFFPNMGWATDQIGYLAIVCLLPFVAIGWVQIYGMYIEDLIKSSFRTVISPKERIYDNGLKIEKKQIKTKKSKDKEWVPFK